MVCPTLECDLAVWCPHKHKDSQLLEKGQWWAVGYITSNYTDLCWKIWTGHVYLNWSCLEQLSWQTWLEMLHKISNDLVDINPASFFCQDEGLWQGAQTEILYQRNDCYYCNIYIRLGLNLKRKEKSCFFFFKRTFSSVNIHAFHPFSSRPKLQVLN